MSRLYENLQTSLKEEDVAYHYRTALGKIFKGSTTMKEYNTDGILYSSDDLKCLFEFKYDLDFKNRKNVIDVLIQCLYYLKDFHNRGEKKPNVIFVGDINEAFVIGSSKLLKYLDRSLDWNIAASNAHNKNVELHSDMTNDEEINPFVFNMDKYAIKDICSTMGSIGRNEQFREEVNANTLSREFDYFTTHIIKTKRLGPNQLSNLFIQLLIDPDDHYRHPNRKAMMATKNFGNVQINPKLFQAFVDRIKEGSFTNKEELVAVGDRLIEDSSRRKKGEYYTPTIWADEGHRRITKTFDENWKEECIVWDPACGTCNLTRDYVIPNLFLSTLNQEDIDTANQMGFNPEATKFQFDFLNDDMELHNPNSWTNSVYKLPAGLIDAFKKNKKIVIFMNPPFGNAYSGLCQGGKAGYNDTKLKDFLVDNNIKVGKSTKELYVQFLLRILLFKRSYNLNNLHLAFFSSPGFMTGEYFIDFRKWFLSEFEFKNGIIFNSGEFSGIQSTWGISFTNWESCKQKQLPPDKFKLEIANISTQGNINSNRTISLYNLDNDIHSRDWILESSEIKDTIYMPTMVNMGVLNDKGHCLKVTKSFIGVYDKSLNAIGRDANIASLVSMPYAPGHGEISIIPKNLLKILSVITAKLSIASDIKNEWLIKELQVLKPNTSHPLFPQFAMDSIVYSIFNPRCRTYSMRQYLYKGRNWDVTNQFFWLSKQYMMDLAKEYNYYSLYKDAQKSKQRYLADLIWKKNKKDISIYSLLSTDAKEVLVRATNLLKISFSLREDYEDNHLYCFDCGYEQLWKIWRDHFPEEFNLFKEKYKAFGERLRPLVYELGFLKGEPLT